MISYWDKIYKVCWIHDLTQHATIMAQHTVLKSERVGAAPWDAIDAAPHLGVNRLRSRSNQRQSKVVVYHALGCEGR
jgi:hypothetical protein